MTITALRIRIHRRGYSISGQAKALALYAALGFVLAAIACAPIIAPYGIVDWLANL